MLWRIRRTVVCDRAWTESHEELFRAINQEMDDYSRSILALSSSEVYGKAEEIAAMRFCYNQLMEHFHEYSAENMEWLRGYQKPLEAVCSHWMIEQNVDLESEFDDVFRGWGYEESRLDMSAPGMS